MKTLADLTFAKVGAPDEDDITSVLMRATLHDAPSGPELPEITWMKRQEAVPFMAELKPSDA